MAESVSQDLESEKTGEKGQDPQGPEKTLSGLDDLDVEELKELVYKFRSEKSKANKEAKRVKDETRAELSAALEELQTYRDRDKTETEKLQSMLERSESRAKAAEDRANARDREFLVLKAGATDPEYVAYKLSQAQSSDKDIDPEEWLEAFKKDHASLFNGKDGKSAEPEKPAAKATGSGGPNLNMGSKASMQAELEQINDEIKNLRMGGGQNRTTKLLALTNRKQEILRSLQ